jgi:penicillin-binding protein 2
VGKVDEQRMREIQAYGYSPDEPVGYAGIEERYDGELRAEPGGRQIQVNSRGQQVRLLSVREPAEGRDVVLTVDQSIQQAAYQALEGRRGAVVALDPATGEVLALVSSPAFDPNDFAQRDDRSRAAGYLRDKDAPLINRAVAGQFPPGSVFKIPVSLAGLQERKFKPTDSFNCPGYFDLGNRHFSFPHAFGRQDFIQAMGHSANEYFFHIGLALGPDLIARHAVLLGLGERTGIDLPYEVKGVIPRRGAFAQWFAGDTANMSIGQGYVLTTPVQVARMMAVVENEGRFVDPYVTASVGGVDAARAQVPRRVSLRPEVWDVVKQGLRAVVKMETGTAHVLDIPGLEIYGKTGTAQAGAGKSDHAWFAGVSKTAQRKFVFVVFLEHGGSSANAALAAKNMLEILQVEGKL